MTTLAVGCATSAYLVVPPDWHGVLAQAIFQCIQGLPEGGLRRIILTASGGAFRDWPVEKLKEVKAADAIKHPNWRCVSPILISCISADLYRAL